MNSYIIARLCFQKSLCEISFKFTNQSRHGDSPSETVPITGGRSFGIDSGLLRVEVNKVLLDDNYFFQRVHM